MNPRLKKIVFLKLEEDLEDSFLFPYSNEIWLLNDSMSVWYFKINSENILDYNQQVMNSSLSVFSLDSNVKNNLLKEWFQFYTKMEVRTIKRLNSNLEWVLEKFSNERMPWDLKNRNGFSYETIKKFLLLIERFNLEKVRILHLKNSSVIE
jgi:hypothetical protein